MNEKVVAFHSKFIVALAESQRYCFISRSKELQIEQGEFLSTFLVQASALKKQMVAADDEDSANAMLSYELMIEAVIEELRMWMMIKEEQWDTAWDHLMDAQSLADTAIRVHSIGDCCKNYREALYLMERLMFPPQLFLSSAIIVEETTCSICGRTYGECDHIVGRVYMGEICTIIIGKIKDIPEVSVVKHPADKRCRAHSFIDDGVERDVMTWMTISDDSPEKDIKIDYGFAGYAARYASRKPSRQIIRKK